MSDVVKRFSFLRMEHLLEGVLEKVLGFILKFCSTVEARNFPASERAVPTPETDLR